MHFLSMSVWNRIIYFPPQKEIIHQTIQLQSLLVMHDHFQNHIDDTVSDNRIRNNDKFQNNGNIEFFKY